MTSPTATFSGGELSRGAATACVAECLAATPPANCIGQGHNMMGRIGTGGEWRSVTLCPAGCQDAIDRTL
jgi:hypothetical protein